MVDPAPVEPRVHAGGPGPRALAAGAALASLVLGAFVLRLGVGEGWDWPSGHWGRAAERLFMGDWLSEKPPAGVIDLRLTRAVVGLLAGACLALSGGTLQALLRNPLADPFILGLSTGAAAGFLLQRVVGHAIGHAISPRHAGALLGGGLTIACVYLMARRRGAVDPLALLLVGVVVSTVNGAVILALHQWAWARGLSTGEELQRWLMGYLDEGLRSYEVLGIAALLGAALARLSRLAGAMDASSFSDAEALSLGVSLGRLRVELFVAAWLLASAAVAMAGPLAFVGMVSPHLARLAVGPRHRGMLWASAAIGAALVMLADAGTRLAEGPFGGRLPLGVFTAWLGGPVFVLLLRRGLRAGAGQA